MGTALDGFICLGLRIWIQTTREKFKGNYNRKGKYEEETCYCFFAWEILHVSAEHSACLPGSNAVSCLFPDTRITPRYCWSTLRIVLDDLKSAKPHLCCRQSGSRLCEMPLMKAFYIFLLQEQFL
jgi:hypothetical protein